MTLNSSIDIGMSGLSGFSQQLQIISNNVANLNTPGFKGSNAQFADLFASDNNANGQGTGTDSGSGLQLLPSVVNFSSGQQTQTGNSTNMFINGNSFFVTKDPKSGLVTYTQDGQFSFDSNGYLTDSTGKTRVQALTTGGVLQDLSLTGLQNSPAKASSAIDITGNLSTTVTPATVSSITVYDSTGGTHTLTATFTQGATAGGVTPFTVAISDASGSVYSGQVQFSSPGGTPVSGHNTLTFTYSPTGVPAIPLTLTMDSASTNVAGSNSVAVKSVDGYGAGSLSSETFDQNGVLQLTYSNAQTVAGPTIALANFTSPNILRQNGNNAFVALNSSAAQLGTAGATSAWGTITAGSIEASNVDLSTEFSEIITTQRGYQAASELISTANQMMQDVLQMKGQGG